MVLRDFLYRSTVGLCIGLLSLSALGQTENEAFEDFKLLGELTECQVAPNENGSYKNLNDFTIRAAYNCARSAMQKAYAQSGFQAAEDYTSWANFSTSPYLSENHASRYVNNYANEIAASGYGHFESMPALPVGSVLAKDSFYVNEEGRVMIGALYLMEKKTPGYNPRHNNWAYTMILPDGTVFASRGGVPSPSVKFCGDCHREVGVKDSLFFVPERYRFQGQ